MPARARCLILAAALLACAALAPAASRGAGFPRLPENGFPYWPAAARSGRPVPLRGGRAFRRALARIAARADRAGWVRVAWDQGKDGGVLLTFARPEPSKAQVTAHLDWTPKTRRGRLHYAAGIRGPWVVVDGFPLCPDTTYGTTVHRMRVRGDLFASVDCDRGEFDVAPEAKAPRFPRVYGWKPVGHAPMGILYERGGAFVSVVTDLDPATGHHKTVALFSGHQDPRKNP